MEFFNKIVKKIQLLLEIPLAVVYILSQKAGSSRNNICIGLSFELIVRRVAASNTPAFFFHTLSRQRIFSGSDRMAFREKNATPAGIFPVFQKFRQHPFEFYPE